MKGLNKQAIKPRAILVVDVQNLFYSVRDIHGRLARINFRRLYERCQERWQLVDAAAYVAIGNPEQTRPFCQSLREAGYRAVTSQIEVDGKRIYETDWDVGITVSVIEMLDQFDVLILASGDGDYQHLIKYLHKKKKKVVSVGFEKEISRALRKFADEVMYLEEKDIFYQAEK